jgi:glycosyltransferase involved in cell wall biosynthesis
MKILYLSSDPGIDLSGRSGGSVHIRAFVRGLSEIGHRVELVASSISSQASLEKEIGVQVHPAPVAKLYRALGWCIKNGNGLIGRHRRHNPDAIRLLHNIKFFRVAAGIAREFQPRFIYERYSLWGLAGGWLARRLRLPFILEVNAPLAYEQELRAGLTLPRLARRVERAIWRRPDFLVAISKELRADLEAAGVPPGRIRVLPNAVDLSLFHKEAERAPLRNKLGLDGRFVIGFVGTFKPWHGVDLLLTAFRELHRDDSSTHLLLVGHGPMYVELAQEVARAGLTTAVTFAGSVPHEDVPSYIAAMDVAVAPAPALDRFYFSPLKIFEYMAMCRPVVAARIGQIAQAITDGANGLLFEPGDVTGLVRQIRRLKQDPKLREELGTEAAASCAIRSWSSNAARLIKWVEPLLDRKQGAAMPEQEGHEEWKWT